MQSSWTVAHHHHSEAGDSVVVTGPGWVSVTTSSPQTLATIGSLTVSVTPAGAVVSCGSESLHWVPGGTTPRVPASWLGLAGGAGAAGDDAGDSSAPAEGGATVALEWLLELDAVRIQFTVDQLRVTQGDAVLAIRNSKVWLVT